MSDRKSRIAGVPATPEFTANERELDAIGQIVANISSMRGEFWKSLMDPRRDVYAECGYPRAGNVTADMLQTLYDNEAIPARVVEVLPKECWQVTPTVYDEESDEVTPFEEAWDNLGKQLRGEQSFYKDEEGSPVWDYLQRLDIMAGIGQYGVLLIGFDDGEDLMMPVKGLEESGSQPVDADRPREEYPANDKGTDTTGGKKQQDGYTPAYPTYSGRKTGTNNALTCNGRPVEYRREKYKLTSNLVYNAFAAPPEPDTSAGSDGSPIGPDGKPKAPSGDKPVAGKGKKILYLRVFPESLAQVTQWETNLDSPRYGQPVMYQMTFGDPRTVTGMTAPPNVTRNVHWTRCIHVPSDGAPTSNEVLGRSRMGQVLHQLMNLTKMYGANGEGYWKEAFGTLVLKTQAAAGVNPRVNKPALRNMVEALQMGLQRELMLQGMDAEMLAPNLTDITPHKDAQLEAICIKIAVPVRVFKGSERGELASSQDDASWNDRLRGRQRSWITPRIIVPFVDRLILCGVLPKPVGGTRKPAKPSMIAPGLPADAAPPTEGAKTPGDVPDPEKLGTDGMAEDLSEPTNKPVPVANAFPPKKAAPAPGKSAPPSSQAPSSQASSEDSVPDSEGQSIEDMVNEGVGTEETGAEMPAEEQEDPGYCVEWPDLDSQTKSEQATIAQGMTTALAAYVSGGLDALISPKDYLTRVCYFDESEVDAMLANTELVKQQKAEEEAAAAEEAMAQQAKMIDEGLAPDPTDPEQMQALGQPPGGGFPPKPGGPPAPGQPPAGPKKPFPPKGPVANYDPSQPRDADGKFGSGGGSVKWGTDTRTGPGTGFHPKSKHVNDPDAAAQFVGLKSRDDLASVAGVSGGVWEVSVGSGEFNGQKFTEVLSRHANGAFSRRTIIRDADGSLLLSNNEFNVPEKARGKGFGASVFSSQVASAKQLGFKEIRTTAAGDGPESGGDGEYNGYYTWARMGYDGNLNSDAKDLFRKKLGLGLNDTPDRVSDVLGRPGGVALWKKYGHEFSGVFDLSDGSYSMKVHAAYLEEKRKAKLTGNSLNGPGDDPDLSADDDAALDRVWAKRSPVANEYTLVGDEWVLNTNCGVSENGFKKGNTCAVGSGTAIEDFLPNPKEWKSYLEELHVNSAGELGHDPKDPFQLTNLCWKASEHLQTILKSKGVETSVVDGTYESKHGDGGVHTWLVTKNGTVIDPTEAQYIGGGEVGDISIHRKGSTGASRYQPDKNTLNSFCATGEGGGVDPSCKPAASSGVVINVTDAHGQQHAPPGSPAGGQFTSGGGGGQAPSSTGTAHTTDAAKGGGSHGKVEVGGNGADPEKVRAVIKATFGKDVDPNLIAKASNLDVGGSVKIGLSATGKMLHVETTNPGGFAIRQFYRSGNDVVVHNDTFKNNLQGGGKGRKGADILADQVKALKEIGVTKIETHAARLDSKDPNTKLVGYAVWPKLGYDGTLKDEQFDKLPEPIKTAMGWKKGKLFGAVGGVKGSRSLQDLYDVPGGPEAWEKHGSGIDAHFDLKDGSRSMKKLEAYLKNRDAKAKG